MLKLKCGVCEECKDYPIHYLYERSNKYMIKYTINENGIRYTDKEYGCIDCYVRKQDKEEDNKSIY